jgi:GNAT superfamily N-acetyltransferase
MRIRRATDADAEAAAETLRRSILELCAADHNDDPAILEPWLANKTPEQFRAWLTDPVGCVVVAETDAAPIAGVAACTDAGEITLLYVSPDARFQGVSKALLAWLEDRLRDRGLTEARLSSSRTAHRLYLARGYRDDGPPVPRRGAISQPMRKAL